MVEETTMRYWYAIEYAYGRTVVNHGNRADRVHRFATKGERTAFVDARERAGTDADPLPATSATVKRALRTAAYTGEWPVAV